MTSTADTYANTPAAGFMRRLFAIIYDLFLLIALWFVSSTMAIALNHGKAIDRSNSYHLVFELALLAISFFYYAYFWTHSGQTLGMKTWRIKLIAKNGRPLSWQQAVLYFFAALLSWAVLGLGFLWSLFDPQRATWHDKIAACRMLDIRELAHPPQ